MKVRALIGMMLVFLIAGVLGGCGLMGKEPAGVTSLTLTDQVDERTKQAVRPISSYPATATQFFASVKVINPAKGTKVTARWLYEGKLVDEAPVQFTDAGDRFVAFNLVSSGNKPFPTGQYRVEIYLDGTLVQNQDFKVE